jgi:hypothetical protein
MKKSVFFLALALQGCTEFVVDDQVSSLGGEAATATYGGEGSNGLAFSVVTLSNSSTTCTMRWRIHHNMGNDPFLVSCTDGRHGSGVATRSNPYYWTDISFILNDGAVGKTRVGLK